MARGHAVFFLLILYFLGFPGAALAQTEEPVAVITGPAQGEALHGQVAVRGTAAGEDFQSAEVSFAYSGKDDTWFPIAEIGQPVALGLLTSWDTTTLTDGVYDLRLVVSRTDGSEQEARIKSVRVRNYTPIETAVPAAAIQAAPEEDAVLPAPTDFAAAPTPLPTNPAEVPARTLYRSLAWGGGTTLAAFALLGIYLALRRLIRGR